MKRIKFTDNICQLKMINHDEIRDRILLEISKTSDGNEYNDSLYSRDSVSKLDWSNSKDPQRPWVKIFLPSFFETIEEFLIKSAYKKINLNDVWYQQYEEGDCHGWHIHSDHFTGVYYLEFPESASSTEICSPYDLKGREIKTTEGDMIIFPSHWIHRGLPNNKDRKTIVSFNFSLDALYIDNVLVHSVNDGKPNTSF